MSQIPMNNTLYNIPAGTPLYQYAGTNSMQQPAPQQTVNVTGPTNSIYQYPQTSVYNDPSKQAASGVNIYIYNPSAIGGPSSNSTASANYTLPPAGQVQNPAPVPTNASAESSAVANTPISGTTEAAQTNSKQKTKKVVELTDDYIKTLESYLRSSDKFVRHNGIVELINRFKEDSSRYEDPALTALLNLALQDRDAENRVLAMSTISAGNAHGDANTVTLLNNLQNSDKLFGEEAKCANSALLKTSEQRITIPDDGTDKIVNNNDESEEEK